MAPPSHISFFMVQHGLVDCETGMIPPYDAILKEDQEALISLAPHLPNGADWHISPLTRAEDTAERLSKLISAKSVTSEPLLEEQDFGDWHNKKEEEVFHDITQHYKQSHPISFLTADQRPPGGTSFQDIYLQVGLFLDAVIASAPHAPQLIIAHAGTIKALLGHMMRLNADQSLMIAIDHASLTHADYISHNNMPETVSPWHIKCVNFTVT